MPSLKVGHAKVTVCHSCGQEEPPQPEPPLSADIIEGMNVAELKTELRDRGLKMGGAKEVLKSRLHAHYLEHGAGYKWFECDGCQRWYRNDYFQVSLSVLCKPVCADKTLLPGVQGNLDKGIYLSFILRWFRLTHSPVHHRTSNFPHPIPLLMLASCIVELIRQPPIIFDSLDNALDQTAERGQVG